METATVIAQGRAIHHAQAQDQQRSIPYRPQYNLITGSPAASILLQQIAYWWEISERQPFYKFRQACEHNLYRDGDSWCEELGFTPSIFDTALKHIGKKITKGVNKTQAAREHIVIYWTDSSRVTWYQVNDDLLAVYLYLAYNAPELLGKLETPIYLDKSGNPFYLGKDETPIYLSSETTSETTPESKEKDPPSADSPDALFPPILQETHAEPDIAGMRDRLGGDYLSVAARSAEKRAQVERPDFTDASRDLDPWQGRPVQEFCALILTPYENVPDSRRRLWATDIQQIAIDAETGAQPEEVGRAIRSITTCPDYEWLRTCNRPTHSGFSSALLNVLCGQALPQERRSGSSTPRRHNPRGGDNISAETLAELEALM